VEIGHQAAAIRPATGTPATARRTAPVAGRLAWSAVVLGFILIVIGAVVRVEGAGMGCGDDWPVCNGKIVPTYSYLTAIEYIHRVVAGIVLLLTAVLAFIARRTTGRDDPRRWLAAVALVLVLAQAGLGAITVVTELDPRIVTAHLALAEGYLALVLVIALLGHQSTRTQAGTQSALRRAALIAASATFALLLSGAYTATSGAAWACPEWPTCQDRYVPTGWTLVDIHLLHRWLAVVALVAITILALRALISTGPRSAATRIAGAALALVAFEILVGAANIWFELANWVRVSHLAVASLVWGCLVASVFLAASSDSSENQAIDVPAPSL
jgi:heme A synthase